MADHLTPEFLDAAFGWPCGHVCGVRKLEHAHEDHAWVSSLRPAPLDAERATVPASDPAYRYADDPNETGPRRTAAIHERLAREFCYVRNCDVPWHMDTAERATVPAPKCCFKTHGIAGDCPLRATVPAPVTPDLRAAAQAVYDIVTEYVEWNDPAWVAQLDALRAALSDRDAEPVSRDPLPCGWRYPSNGGHCWAPEAWHDGEKGKHAYVPEERRSGADRRKASRDPLRLDPEDLESVERLARALLPGHDFMHEGDRDTCSERDMPAAMEAAERIARAFAAPVGGIVRY